MRVLCAAGLLSFGLVGLRVGRGARHVGFHGGFEFRFNSRAITRASPKAIPPTKAVLLLRSTGTCRGRHSEMAMALGLN